MIRSGIAVDVYVRRADDRAPVPVILPLREWKGDTALETFIERRLGALASEYSRLMDARKLYLLCDGLNEIDRDGHRKAKVDALRDALSSMA